MSEHERDRPPERERPDPPPARDREKKPKHSGNPWAKTSSGDKEHVTDDE